MIWEGVVKKSNLKCYAPLVRKNLEGFFNYFLINKHRAELLQAGCLNLERVKTEGES